MVCSDRIRSLYLLCNHRIGMVIHILIDLQAPVFQIMPFFKYKAIRKFNKAVEDIMAKNVRGIPTIAIILHDISVLLFLDLIVDVA